MELIKKAERNSNIEILRILSMLLIIAFHLARNVADADSSVIVFTSHTVFGTWGLLGVDLFVIISAWFLSTQKFRIFKVINLVFQTFTWVIGYVFVFAIYHITSHSNSLISLLKDFFQYSMKGLFQPLWSNYYWFVTTYFFMLLLSPFMNKLLSSLTKSQMKKVLLAFAFIPLYAQHCGDVNNNIASFLFLYFLIGYVRKYDSAVVKKYAKISYIVTIIIMIVAAKFAIRFMPSDNGIFYLIRFLLYKTLAETGRHSIITLILSILIFFYVINRPERHNENINRVASASLGVYLFHETCILNYPNTLDAIYSRLFSMGFFVPTIRFPLEYVALVLCVYFVGLSIELLRDRIIQKPFMSWLSKKYSGQLEQIDNWFNIL